MCTFPPTFISAASSHLFVGSLGTNPSSLVLRNRAQPPINKVRTAVSRLLAASCVARRLVLSAYHARRTKSCRFPASPGFDGPVWRAIRRRGRLRPPRRTCDFDSPQLEPGKYIITVAVSFCSTRCPSLSLRYWPLPCSPWGHSSWLFLVILRGGGSALLPPHG